MPSATQLIFTDNPGDLPATYRVPASMEIVLASVFARFDGSGAGGDFVPTLDLMSQSGQLMARVAVTQTLAAGDLARVTWAPFLRKAAAAPTPPPAGTVTQMLMGRSTTDIAAAPTVMVYSAVLGGSDGTYFQVNGAGNLEILAQGVYGLQWSTSNFVLSAGVTTSLAIDVTPIAGTAGRWTQSAPNGAQGIFGEYAPRVVDAATALDFNLFPVPDVFSYARWRSSDTFPVEIETTYTYREDGVDTATTFPRSGFTVIRLGDSID